MSSRIAPPRSRCWKESGSYPPRTSNLLDRRTGLCRGRQNGSRRGISITAVEIGHGLDIEKSTLSRNLKRLLALGLIIMDPPAGRRGRGLHLTSKGQAVIKEAYPLWQAAQKRATEVMGRDSRATLDDLVQHAERLAVA